MAKEYRTCIVRTFDGKKIKIPGVENIILSVKGANSQQFQASVDVTIPNINELKKIIRREWK